MEELFSRDRKLPKGMLILVPAVAFLIIIGMGTYKRTDVPTAGKTVPNFTAPLLVGDGDLSLASLRGKPVVMNFWASWCAPCEDEAPLFKRAYEEYGDRITFLGVDIRDAHSDALEFVDDFDLDYPSVRDEGMEVYADYGLTGQPETFFIDANGVLVEHVAGPVDEAGLFQLLDVLVRRDA
ncbi:MAG: cytochrome c biosis protein CcmG, thiol:disulfide interchange protein DsbE [Actinomycetota bacterium]|jgi:cytochrome c biogenesis protein CcmG/thiol:disulfide interchange protein DsbE|nr:cytochrome c biosis protein CcmG, thiol:disulfide interchange protein DsbE [Actinomycetota bacterium]